MVEADQNKREALRWQFWFSAVFSLFIIATFALYLPLRFANEVLLIEHRESRMEGAMAEPAHDNGMKMALYHEEEEVMEGLLVNLNVVPVPIRAGSPIRLDFFVNKKPGNIPLSVSELEIDHTKAIHVIGVRNDMNEFFHIHPSNEVNPDTAEATLSVFHTFQNPGIYKIWSEIKHDGVLHSFGHPEVTVQGEGPTFEKAVDFGRNVIIGNYQIALRAGRSVAAGRTVDLLFDIHTLDSRQVELEDYLGAKIHLAVIKDDWQQFLHTHPVDILDHHQGFLTIPGALANGGDHDTGQEGHGVLFRVTFPEPRLYKVFAQFRPQGIDLPEDEALLAAFWVQVEERAAFAVSEWWLYLMASTILIVILSYLIKKYITAPVAR